ncbi:MOSC domain-containing protein [Zhongshania sp. BJYM1]|uniref:MOSC domain-containing protein n=1 Tax=Zhongshania aquatica TaxID=2965069 RepID=UPI0022B30895|nr:MOSC N-terminal beta barrel domain-containing protein [Marortus sp. BJYM1]
MPLTVSSLWQYPVKSLAGVPLKRMQITSWGPHLDRRWMVVDDQGRFATQRQLPAMSRLAASQTERGVRIQSLDDSSQFIEVRQPSDDSDSLVSVWSDDCVASDAGDEVAEWLRRQLGKDLRLCFMQENTFRQVDTQYAAAGVRVSFADGFPFLLCSDDSVAALSKALGRDLDIRRFRPNIVVSGAEAFAEDSWRRIRIADVDFELVKPCARCAIPTINLDSGIREPDVFKLLRTERQRDGDVFFGQNLIQCGEGDIAVGQRVEIIA